MPESNKVESNCFGCAPTNPIGLRLLLTQSGNRYTATVKLGVNYESFPGVIHGGIVTTVLDEMLAQAVYRSGRISALTTGLRIRFARTMETDIEHTVFAEISKADDVLVRASARLDRLDGDLVAVADGHFHLLTDDVLDRTEANLPADLVHALRTVNGSII